MLDLPTLDKENVTLQLPSHVRKKPPHVDKAPITTTSQFGQLKHWRKLWLSLEKKHFHCGKQASNGIYQSIPF
jgi:hypothetical protein